MQMIDIPERVYRGHHYSDGFVKAWAKMAGLDVDGNEEHCNASVGQMARFSGLSVRAFERALTEGRAPGPDGGPAEFTTRRMTRSGGTGRTAIRQVRPVRDGERHVRVSMTMCDALEPRRLRAALLMLHADKYTPGYTPTAAELAGELYHHSGESAGTPLSDRTARRIIGDLEDAGWIDVGHRAGHQGRNTVAVRPHPLIPSAAAAAAADRAPGSVAAESSADIHGGSGTDTSGGSLAIKEYTGAVTDEMAQVVGGSRRRRGTGSRPVDNSGDLVPATFGPGESRAPRGNHPSRLADDQPTTTGPYTGPELRWTRRIHDALAPVRSDLDGIRRHVLRQIAVMIGTELDANPASSSDRIADRISRRLRPVMREDIRSMGGWLLKAGLPHRGCGQDTCEDGAVWPTGEPCETCAYADQVQRAQWRQAREWQDRLAELRARQHDGTETPAETERRERLAGYEEQLRAAVEQETELRAAAGAERARLLEELGEQPLPMRGGTVRWKPGPEWPAKASYRERSAVADEVIVEAIGELGPAVALHVYGHLRTAPLLRHLGHDLPVLVPAPDPTPAAQPAPAGSSTGRETRAAIRRTTDACPEPGCPARAGESCRTPRGRRRAPHKARIDAVPTAAHAAARGEDTA
ncbi:hypothetical protein [Streptomyces sp. NPDC055109]